MFEHNDEQRIPPDCSGWSFRAVGRPVAPGRCVNSDLHVYLAEIHRTAALTAEEEKELGWKIINDGCAASRSQMVQTNLRLVAAIAGNYAGRGHSLAELIDAGIVGLIRAVDGFDPAWGARFSTYASWWIKQAIKQSLLSNEQPVLA